MLSERDIRWLSAMAATVGFGQSALLALVPVIAGRTGLDAPAIGAVAFAGALTFLVGAPLWGRRPQALRARFRVLAALMIVGQSLFLAALVLPALPAAAALGLLALSRIIYSAGAAGLMPHAQATVARATAPARRPAALARLSAGLGGGRILGSLATLPGAAGLWPLLVAMALSPLTLLAAPDVRKPEPADATGMRLPQLARAVGPLLAIGFALTLGFGQIQMTLGLFLQAQFGMDAHAAARWAGVSYALTAIVMIAVQLHLTPRLSGGAMGVMRFGLALFAFGSGVMLAPLLPLLVAGALLAGAGVALATPAYTAALVGRVAPGQQASAAGWLASVHVLGQGAGALTGGLMFAMWPGAPFLFCTCIGLAFALALPWFFAGKPGEPADAGP